MIMYTKGYILNITIHIDIPRTNPLIPLFQQASVQEIFERILFIWAIRHPASGYVQGINDLVTPFFVVYVFEYIDMRTFLIQLFRDHSSRFHQPSDRKIAQMFRSTIMVLQIIALVFSSAEKAKRRLCWFCRKEHSCA
ncbi:UNVERIFIED_CONTAM: hypothetical protein FKN15_009548 [Acipenser sinensis]